MDLNLSKNVIRYLQAHLNQKYTAREIALWIYETYPYECEEKLKRSNRLHSKDDLIAQIVAEIGSKRPQLQAKYPQLKITTDRPQKYYYVQTRREKPAVPVEDSNSFETRDVGLKEHDLYPRLSEFLWTEFSLYSKRINEKHSSNKRGPKGNMWLYPDIIAMENLSAEWHREVKDCAGQYADKRTRLWSFEVKLHINRSNIRECFFQTVSNSSWANLGYLVVAEISSDAIKELRILSTLHGIGLIQLDADNPPKSQILAPAKERITIDWNSVNRLAEENKDFMTFIKQVRKFYQTGDPGAATWDYQKK